MEYLRRGAADRPAIQGASGGHSLSYTMLRAGSQALAGHLKSCGVRPGSRGALLLATTPELALALFGLLHQGASAMPVDLSLRGSSLRDILDALRPDLVVTTQMLLSRIEPYVPQGVTLLILQWEDSSSGHPALVVTTRSRQAVQVTRLPLEQPGEPPAPGSQGESFTESQDALLIATSGSTGLPKLVRLSHGAVLANMRMHLASLGLSRPYSALQILGTTYSYGLVASFLSTLYAGGTVVLPRFLDRKHILQAVAEHHPEICLGTPALFRLLLEESAVGDLQALRGLRKLGIGGDRCPPYQRAALREALPDTELYVTYGLTEAGPRVTTLPPELVLEKAESVGRPLENVALRVVDAGGRTCGPGEVGHLQIQTPSLMTGYLGDTPFPEGGTPGAWYQASDLASLDEDGFLYLHGRVDRQCKFRGRRINPASVERCLESHPAVALATVTVVQEGEKEFLRATIHHRSTAIPDLQRELLSRCKQNLPPSLVPDELILAVDEGLYFKRRKLTG